MSRIPDGLVRMLEGLAERLEHSPEIGRTKASETLVLSAVNRDRLTDTFLATWFAGECSQAAREIRIALEVWSRPPPRARRRSRR